MSVLSFPAFSARVRRVEHVMGTVVSFDVPARARDDGSLDSAIAWLHWVDRVFSPYRPDSDVSLLARAEAAVEACAPEVAARARDWTAPLEDYEAFAITTAGDTWRTTGFTRYISTD